MDRLELAAAVHEMKDSASYYVKRYAATHARDVDPETIAAICNALGDFISINEATAALDRLQREANEAR
jgi:hypothetical protein